MTAAESPGLKATVLGASGMVGIEVLHECFAEPRSLHRRVAADHFL